MTVNTVNRVIRHTARPNKTVRETSHSRDSYKREYRTQFQELRTLYYTATMHTKIQLLTHPPVDVIIYSKGRKFYWRFNYEGCITYGSFKSYTSALLDARTHSTQ